MKHAIAKCTKQINQRCAVRLSVEKASVGVGSSAALGDVTLQPGRCAAVEGDRYLCKNVCFFLLDEKLFELLR